MKPGAVDCGVDQSSTFRWQLRIAFALLALLSVAASPRVVSAAEWNPATFAKESTLKLRTVVPGEGEYWFPVWLVTIDF